MLNVHYLQVLHVQTFIHLRNKLLINQYIKFDNSLNTTKFYFVQLSKIKSSCVLTIIKLYVFIYYIKQREFACQIINLKDLLPYQTYFVFFTH